MPCDSMLINNSNPVFTETLDVLEQFIPDGDYDRVILCGDWNTKVERQDRMCNNFLNRNGFKQ